MIGRGLAGFLVGVSLALGSGSVLGFDGCSAGEDAFAGSVHPFLREHCAFCHDRNEGQQQGPRFAVEDVFASYKQVLGLVNFDDISGSHFVKKGGSGHCSNYGIDCGVTSPQPVMEVAQEWWEQGEKDCPRLGRFVTPALTLPASLPDFGNGFKTMEWDLSAFGGPFASAKFQLDVQIFARKSDATDGAYRVKSPRLVGFEGTVRVKDIKLIVNGKFNPFENTYRSVKKFISEKSHGDYPLLSATPMVVLADNIGSDTVSISFEELSSSSPRPCKEQQLFKQKVMPLFHIRGCDYCHSVSSTGDGVKAFLLVEDEVELCRSVKERADMEYVWNSVIVRKILQGNDSHPKVLLSSAEARAGLIPWLEAEQLAQDVTYYDDIRPLLQDACVGCHDATVYKGKLDLDGFPFSSGSMGTDQELIVLEVIKRVKGTAKPMPPKGPISSQSIDLIQTWYDQGLKPN